MNPLVYDPTGWAAAMEEAQERLDAGLPTTIGRDCSWYRALVGKPCGECPRCEREGLS